MEVLYPINPNLDVLVAFSLLSYLTFCCITLDTHSVLSSRGDTSGAHVEAVFVRIQTI